MTYLDVWRSGTFLLYSCKAGFWIQETLPRLSDVERSVVLRSVFAIGSALAYLLFLWECATPPHVQIRHTMWLSFTVPSPALVLQATNAGVRRPGYEARVLARIWTSVHDSNHYDVDRIFVGLSWELHYRIVRSSDGRRQGDKRVHNSTTKVSFCTIIIHLCHRMIAITRV